MIDSQATQSSVQRIALGIEYDGTVYSGWQKQLQPLQNTIQAKLEKALSQVANSSITVNCAGRTDAGVHATCQVVHFDSVADRDNKAWVMGVNSLLPDTIRVLWAQLQASDFHARFSATARRYNYVIYRSPVAPAILSKKVTHERGQLDVEAMHKAAQFLIGEQDFSSFQAAGCQSKSSFRNVIHARVLESGQFVILDIKANAFLQHMVRNIVGALLEVGKGIQDPAWIQQLLSEKDRSKGAITAPPHGLYLVDVDYPTQFDLPDHSSRPGFLGQR